MTSSPTTVRASIERLARERGLNLMSLSRTIGRNDAYLQQFVRRGTPVRLPEEERLRLAMALNIDERELGARDPWAPPIHKRLTTEAYCRESAGVTVRARGSAAHDER